MEKSFQGLCFNESNWVLKFGVLTEALILFLRESSKSRTQGIGLLSDWSCHHLHRFAVG